MNILISQNLPIVKQNYVAIFRYLNNTATKQGKKQADINDLAAFIDTVRPPANASKIISHQRTISEVNTSLEQDSLKVK